MVDKSNYSIIRFRNHNANTLKVSKKKKIKKLINRYKINIIKKFYGRKNYICNSFLFSYIAYYTVYFITRDAIHLNYEVSFIEKIRGIKMVDVGSGLIAIGAGLAVGLTGLGAGMAEKDVGAAAVGAITEDQSLFGKAMIFMVLPETIVIFGLVIAILGIFVM